MSIVSDDPDSDSHLPTAGPRRVSVLVALPVILGCAVVGSIVGITHPLRSFFPGEPRSGELPDLSLSSLKLVETPPAEAQQRPATEKPPATAPEQPEAVTAASVASQAQSPASSAVVSVSTGSLERSPPPVSEDAAPTATDRPDAARTETPDRVTAQGHPMARAKRLKRVLWRRTRAKPPASAIDGFFSSLLTKN